MILKAKTTSRTEERNNAKKYLTTLRCTTRIAPLARGLSCSHSVYWPFPSSSRFFLSLLIVLKMKMITCSLESSSKSCFDTITRSQDLSHAQLKTSFSKMKMIIFRTMRRLKKREDDHSEYLPYNEAYNEAAMRTQ